MIDISTVGVWGFGGALHGMRNPLNSWDRADSRWNGATNYFSGDPDWEIGPNDKSLATRLRDAGEEHRKYMRMIHVQVDILAPLYWWKEFDTYKVGTVANSCSTMHKIQAKEFTREDFSMEHLIEGTPDIRYTDKADSTPYYPGSSAAKDIYPTDAMDLIIELLNSSRDLYLRTKDKKYWWQMIQLLPSSYNQKRTVDLNYEVLYKIYRQREGHKLDEWHDFRDWCETLPEAWLITGEE